MTWVSVRNLDAGGLVKDQPDTELPPEVWTSAVNCRFEDGAVKRAVGEATVKGSVSVPPYFIMPAPGLAPAWTYTDGANVYHVDSAGTHTLITRVSGGAYTGGADNKWCSTWLNGVMVFTNGVDSPQGWAAVDSGTRLGDLANWPSGWKAKIIRSYKNFLCAYNITKGSTNFPTLCSWSNLTQAGAFPDSWDVSDPTKLTGDRPLSETDGAIVDAIPLRDSMAVFKSDSIVLQNATQNGVFSFRTVNSAVGLLAQGCAKEIRPGLVFFVTRDLDFALFNGQELEAIGDGVMSQYLRDDISTQYQNRCYVCVDRVRTQVIIAYVRKGDNFCEHAIVWNWRTRKFATRELTPSLSMEAEQNLNASGTLELGDAVIGGDIQFGQERLFQLTPAAYTINGSTFTMTLERTGLGLVGQGRDGSPKVDFSRGKILKGVRPLVVGSGPLNVFVGAKEKQNDSYTWQGPFAFNPTSDEQVDPLIEGRFLAVRFVHSDASDISIVGYDLDVSVVGRFL